MISIEIPGSAKLTLKHLVLDYNGTIALDGEVIHECIPLLQQLSNDLTLYVLTADTHGTVKQKLKGLPCKLHIIGENEQDRLKLLFIQELGPENTVALGNGKNDALMLKNAALGIGLIQAEGANIAAILAADILCTNIVDALSLLTKPNRITATMRN